MKKYKISITIENTENLFKIYRNILGVFAKASSTSETEFISNLMKYKESVDDFFTINKEKK